MVYTPAVTSIKKMHRWHQIPLDTNQSSAVLSCPDRLLLLNQCQPDVFNGVPNLCYSWWLDCFSEKKKKKKNQTDGLLVSVACSIHVDKEPKMTAEGRSREWSQMSKASSLTASLMLTWSSAATQKCFRRLPSNKQQHTDRHRFHSGVWNLYYLILQPTSVPRGPWHLACSDWCWQENSSAC